MKVLVQKQNPFHKDLGPSVPMLYMEPENDKDRETLLAIIENYRYIGMGMLRNEAGVLVPGHVEVELEQPGVDWSGWIAVLFDNGDRDVWHIAPREFWEEYHFIPDHCLDDVPEGFYESSEHCLNSNLGGLTKQKKMLKELGFKIVKWPE